MAETWHSAWVFTALQKWAAHSNAGLPGMSELRIVKSDNKIKLMIGDLEQAVIEVTPIG